MIGGLLLLLVSAFVEHVVSQCAGPDVGAGGANVPAGCNTPALAFQYSSVSGIANSATPGLLCAGITGTFAAGQTIDLDWYATDPALNTNNVSPINDADDNTNFVVTSVSFLPNGLIDTALLTGTNYGGIYTIQVTGGCGGNVQFQQSGSPEETYVLTSTGVASYPTTFDVTFAVGDPHFVGPNGETFDFNGQSGAAYTLLSSARYTINMQLDDLAPGHARFMTKFGIVVGGASVVLDTVRHNANYIAGLNKKLSLAGAKASYGKTAKGDNTFQTVIDVCAGQRIIVTQKRTTPVTEKKMNLNSTLHYLDFELDIAGCHDEFGGVVGQLHQCKYATTKFVWDPKSEESFRVPTLTTPSSSSSKDAPCLASHQFGAAFSGKAKSR